MIDRAGRIGPAATRVVHVVRTDGSWLAVTLSAERTGEFALTTAQQEAVAFDPAISLPKKQGQLHCQRVGSNWSAVGKAYALDGWIS